MSRLQRLGICRHATWGGPRLLHYAPLVLLKVLTGISLNQVCHCLWEGKFLTKSTYGLLLEINAITATNNAEPIIDQMIGKLVVPI